MSATTLVSINPTTGEEFDRFAVHTAAQVEQFIAESAAAQRQWATTTTFDERSKVLHATAKHLRKRSVELAELMANEMGKPLASGAAEVEKCAWVCEYYADNAADMLADEERSSDLSQAWTVYEPMGTVLAVMPWNFPLWQVFRFAAPALMAGNAGMLKHASNVSGSAMAIEDLFRSAGLGEGLFRTLLIPSDRVAAIIGDPRIAAVTLTGSEPAGRSVAEAAGRHLKPSLLELGGSDPYVVLHDADIDEAARICADSRLTNSGQSCIAAKRFIVVDDVYDQFRAAFLAELEAAVVGDPHDSETTVGPQARTDLRDSLHEQVERAVEAGAEIVLGGNVPDGPGAFYPVTVLENVGPGNPAFDEELFGPVAPLIRADDEEHAIALANDSSFGLGGAVFTGDTERGRQIAAHRIRTGNCFVNAKVASDPRLPFGGIGNSGYGRELSELGIRTFVNAKTVAIK
ncbi:MAG: NAD-dependent succinate-semialdehyde dehydrogenase [Acidimicrobiales bacterium]|nr:NAD-dependent succinate-semialdehyde dehydrogenase [Acidimicrobiales bacterium]